MGAGCIFRALGIVGLLVGAAGGQFVQPGASHARLPGASTLGQIRQEMHKHKIHSNHNGLIQNLDTYMVFLSDPGKPGVRSLGPNGRQ